MLKIFVNLDSLSPPLTGIGYYTLGIMTELMKDQRVEVIGQYCGVWKSSNEIKILIDKVNDEAISHAVKHPLASSRIRRWIKKIPFARSLYVMLKHIALTRKKPIFEYPDAIYWEPNFILQSFWQHKAVTTIHDIAYIRRPEFHEKETIDYLTKKVPESLSKSNYVITVSNFSRQEVIDYYHLPPEKVGIVRPAVSYQFFQERTMDELAKIKKKYQLPDNFILSLGTLEPRKNLQGLMQAYQRLPSDIQNAYPLVLVGCQGWLMSQFSEALVSLEAKGLVIRLGYVSREDLPCIIKLATVMAYISHYEGFGMPVAEAMASGTVVLTSLGTSMEEVAQGTAHLVNPSDIGDVAQGLLYLLENESIRFHLAEQAKVVAQSYTWATSANDLVNILYSLHSESQINL